MPAEAYRELEKSKVGFNTTIRDYLLESINEGIEPIMGVLVPVPKTKDNSPDSPNGSPVDLEGTAVFQNFKLVGYLDSSETRALLWIKGERQRGIFTAKVPQANGYVSVEMRNESSEIVPIIRGQQVDMSIKIHSDAIIHENGTNLGLGLPENMMLVQQAMNESLHKRVRNVIDRAQHDFHQDIFGFGREIHRHDPKTWHALRSEWPAKFPETSIVLDIKLDLVQLGMVKAPLHICLTG